MKFLARVATRYTFQKIGALGQRLTEYSAMQAIGNVPLHLPRKGEYGDTGVFDGGNTWGQPFEFTSIAHLMIPSKFEFSDIYKGEFVYKETEQNILELSRRLQEEQINHFISCWALELRLIP